MTALGVVREIWRFPVKSMQGARLARAAVGPAGLPGDRAWALCDPVARAILGAKEFPQLMRCAAAFRAGDEGPVDITLPDGDRVASDDPAIHARLSALLGMPLVLCPAPAPPEPAWFDDAPLHFLTTAELAHLRSHNPTAHWDVRRFRPNLVIEADADATRILVEPDRRFRIGGLVIQVAGPTARCSMTTRATADLPFDVSVLRTVAEVAGADLGAYAHVLEPGEVREGDPVEAV